MAVHLIITLVLLNLIMVIPVQILVSLITAVLLQIVEELIILIIHFKMVIVLLMEEVGLVIGIGTKMEI